MMHMFAISWNALSCSPVVSAAAKDASTSPAKV